MEWREDDESLSLLAIISSILPGFGGQPRRRRRKNRPELMAKRTRARQACGQQCTVFGPRERVQCRGCSLHDDDHSMSTTGAFNRACTDILSCRRGLEK